MTRPKETRKKSQKRGKESTFFSYGDTLRIILPILSSDSQTIISAKVIERGLLFIVQLTKMLSGPEYDLL